MEKLVHDFYLLTMKKAPDLLMESCRKESEHLKATIVSCENMLDKIRNGPNIEDVETWGKFLQVG